MDPDPKSTSGPYLDPKKLFGFKILLKDPNLTHLAAIVNNQKGLIWIRNKYFGSKTLLTDPDPTHLSAIVNKQKIYIHSLLIKTFYMVQSNLLLTCFHYQFGYRGNVLKKRKGQQCCASGSASGRCKNVLIKKKAFLQC